MKKKILRIAIDGNEANVSQRVGSNAYAFELLSTLEKMTADQEDVLFTILLTDAPVKELPTTRKGWKYRVFGPKALWTQFALPLYLWKHQNEIDVFFTPGHYAPRVSVIPYVSSVMDLAFLEFPRQFKKKDFLQLSEWTRYSVKHAKKIIAISQHTRKDVIERYKVKPDKVVVAYPAINVDQKLTIKESERIQTLKKWNIKQPYLLYVGTTQPRKNLVRLVEAFEELVKKGSSSKKSPFINGNKVNELQLVIAGKVGWLAEPILERIKDSPLKEKIILTGYISEKEKIILFRESLCTVLIGLYEGFGIPALEALHYGSIPIVSNTTSLPEVVGNAGLLVDPQNTTEISKALQKIIEMSAKERAKMLKRGREQLKKFSWQKSAEVVLRTLQTL